MELDEQKINEIAEMRVRKEVKQGVQVIQYQVITLMTTNGQAPFVTVFMYLDEVEEGPARDDLAMIIEEMLNQRISHPLSPSLFTFLRKTIFMRTANTGILQS